MKKFKKIVIGLGVTAGIAGPIVAVASCGETDSHSSNKVDPELEKLNNFNKITSKDVHDYLEGKGLTVDATALPSAWVTTESLTIGKKYEAGPISKTPDVDITIENIISNDSHGTVQMNLMLHSTSVGSSNSIVVYFDGFDSYKRMIESVTDTDISTALSLSTLDKNLLPSQAKSNIPSTKDVSISGFPNPVHLAITATESNSTGSLTLSVEPSYTPPFHAEGKVSKDAPISITIDGFLNDRNPLNAITQANVIDILRLTNVDKDQSPGAVTKPNITGTTTIAGVAGLTVTIPTWTIDYTAGTITVGVSLSNGTNSRSFNFTLSGFLTPTKYLQSASAGQNLNNYVSIATSFREKLPSEIVDSNVTIKSIPASKGYPATTITIDTGSGDAGGFTPNDDAGTLAVSVKLSLTYQDQESNNHTVESSTAVNFTQFKTSQGAATDAFGMITEANIASALQIPADHTSILASALKAQILKLILSPITKTTHGIDYTIALSVEDADIAIDDTAGTMDVTVHYTSSTPAGFTGDNTFNFTGFQTTP